MHVEKANFRKAEVQFFRNLSCPYAHFRIRVSRVACFTWNDIILAYFEYLLYHSPLLAVLIISECDYGFGYSAFENAFSLLTFTKFIYASFQDCSRRTSVRKVFSDSVRRYVVLLWSRAKFKL